jgi:hypothetical protein
MGEDEEESSYDEDDDEERSHDWLDAFVEEDDEPMAEHTSWPSAYGARRGRGREDRRERVPEALGVGVPQGGIRKSHAPKVHGVAMPRGGVGEGQAPEPRDAVLFSRPRAAKMAARKRPCPDTAGSGSAAPAAKRRRPMSQR